MARQDYDQKKAGYVEREIIAACDRLKVGQEKADSLIKILSEVEDTTTGISEEELRIEAGIEPEIYDALLDSLSRRQVVNAVRGMVWINNPTLHYAVKKGMDVRLVEEDAACAGRPSCPAQPDSREGHPCTLAESMGEHNLPREIEGKENLRN